jgi:hypothetical protein
MDLKDGFTVPDAPAPRRAPWVSPRLYQKAVTESEASFGCFSDGSCLS